MKAALTLQSQQQLSFTEEEQPFLAFIPDWIEQLHGKYLEDREMSQDYYENLMDSYHRCFVGDLRAKLGLSRYYFGGEEQDGGSCNNCRDLAYDMARIRGKNDYLHNLDRIKIHMGVEHQKNI